MERTRVYMIIAATLVAILIASLLIQINARQAPADKEKEKVKKELTNKTCADKRLKGVSFYECDNGFYSKESCSDCWECYYDNSGNLTKCCGGYAGACKVYQNYDVVNCSKRDLCS